MHHDATSRGLRGFAREPALCCFDHRTQPAAPQQVLLPREPEREGIGSVLGARQIEQQVERALEQGRRLPSERQARRENELPTREELAPAKCRCFLKTLCTLWCNLPLPKRDTATTRMRPAP